MRISILILICCSLIMCKSKDAIPAEEPISYVVVLDKSSSPNKLRSKIKHDIVESSQYMDFEGQWLILFKNEGDKSKKIKADLLNQDIVFGVYTKEQIDEINSKTRKKERTGIKPNITSKQD